MILLLQQDIPCKYDMSKEAKRLRKSLQDNLQQLLDILEYGDCDIQKVTREIYAIQKKLNYV